MAMYSLNIGDSGWSNSTYSYLQTSSSGTTWPVTARVVLDDVPVSPPTPRSEVQRLLADVEQVCALAR